MFGGGRYLTEIKETEYGEFCIAKLKFIVGEYATYNRYYIIHIHRADMKATFGLQEFYCGILPQVDVFESKILIGAGETFRVCDFAGNLIKQYPIGSAFYQFLVDKEHVLVIGEADVLLLGKAFQVVWHRRFNEIIDLRGIGNDCIELIDYNQKPIKLDFFSGENIR